MRILVVDDDAALRLMARTILESAGHSVVEAENGSVALKSFQAAPVDVVVTDIIMPEKEGMETIIALRRLNKDVRIVVVSGGGHGYKLDFLKLARGLGATAALPKPFRRSELLDCVEGRSNGLYDEKD